MSDLEPTEMVVDRARHSPLRNLSLVWLVPILALAVTLFVAWQTYADRGTLIEISFENAAGIVPGDSTLRYRDVVVGTVESVKFAPGLTSIIVSVRVERDIAEVLPPEAQFWVVQPEVSTTGVSGLSTVLSGVYLQVAFEPTPDSNATNFVGLDQTPLVTPGMQGTTITLRAATASALSAGAPIFYKGIEVGKIQAPRLLASQNGVAFDAFVNAPYNSLLNSATRFWVTSGFSLNVGTGGLDLSVGSLSNLVRGGLSFDTVFSGGRPIEADQIYDLFDDEDAARGSVFSETIDNAIELAVEFDESVSGLSAGSQVVYRGVRIGTVSGIGAYIEDGPTGKDVKLRATLSIDPQRLGLDPEVPESAALDFFKGAVSEGMRARLVWQSIFSQALVVELAELPNSEPAELIMMTDALPLLPSVKSDLPDVGATAEGLLSRIDNLPVEDLMQQTIDTLASIESFVGDDKLRSAPGAFVDLMDDARGWVGSEDAQALPGIINTAATQLLAVTEELQKAEAVTKLVNALDATSQTAVSFAGIADALVEPAGELKMLFTDLQELTEKANALGLDEFLTSAQEFLDGADRLIDTDVARALPESITLTLNEAQAAISELRNGGVVENTNAAITSAREAAEAVQDAAENLPELTARIQRMVAEAERVVSSYDGESTFNRETVSSLREVRAAAEALSKLARSIERNPNSLLFGR